MCFRINFKSVAVHRASTWRHCFLLSVGEFCRQNQAENLPRKVENFAVCIINMGVEIVELSPGDGKPEDHCKFSSGFSCLWWKNWHWKVEICGTCQIMFASSSPLIFLCVNRYHLPEARPDRSGSLHRWVKYLLDIDKVNKHGELFICRNTRQWNDIRLITYSRQALQVQDRKGRSHPRLGWRIRQIVGRNESQVDLLARLRLRRPR